MKTINLELSKRLAPYLEGVETEYFYQEYKRYVWDGEVKNWNDWILCNRENATFYEHQDIKTLTLEWAILLLPATLSEWSNHYEMTIKRGTAWINNYIVSYVYVFDKHKKNLCNKYCEWNESLLVAIEKMLTYLLENNLLTK